MRKTLFGMAAVAALTLSSTANAAITIGSNVGSTSPIYAGPTPITYDFSSSIPTHTGGTIKTGNDGLNSSVPLGSDGIYYSVGPHDGSPGVIDLSSWGGLIDQYLIGAHIDSRIRDAGVAITIIWNRFACV